MGRSLLLRFIHGLFALYFISCLIYLYYAAIFAKLDDLLLIAVISLGMEGFIVFILNKGDCPLIHIQRRIGDNTPFFNLFFPAKVAKRAIPTFAKITWVGVALLIFRIMLTYVYKMGR